MSVGTIVKKYTTLFFDLDDTLIDFQKSESNAIKKVLKKFELPSNDENVKLYSKINLSYWKKYEIGEIEKSEIFINRFITFLSELGYSRNPEELNKYYFSMLSQEYPLIDGALAVLKNARNNGLKICITTNGYSYTQFRRIKESRIGDYTDFIIISEDAGFQKPEKGYFDYAMNKCGEVDRKRILIIGDSQSSDISGAINSNIDSCWYNPKGQKANYHSKYEIKKLIELYDVLGI
ncbi:MAG: YjjG family noncanonical pyrimidine nucleotidase [Clostridia bacterium]|nr:YjjG family noncanonical pyrimidine nucleotidase [Clostridia bacterium]